MSENSIPSVQTRSTEFIGDPGFCGYICGYIKSSAMPKLAFATDRQLKMAKPRTSDYRIGCGGQLFLRITPVGRKYWQVRYYKIDGKESIHQFAIYPQTSLAEAKQKLADLLAVLLAGQPVPNVVAKQTARAALTFDQCATLYIQAKSPEWKNAKHAQQWTNTLTQHASPIFGNAPVGAIGREDVLRCLELPFTHNYFHPDLAAPSANPAHIMCKQA